MYLVNQIHRSRAKVDVQPIHPDCGQVLDVQLHERAREAVGHVCHLLVLELVLELAGEHVGLVLKPPADGVHGDADNGFHWRKDHLHL